MRDSRTDGDTLDLYPPCDDDLPSAVEALADDIVRWPRQMAEMTDTIEDELTRLEQPLEPVAARRLACRVMGRLAREHGGSCMYLPKGDALERRLRDAWLWAEYDGTADGPRGVEALAKKTSLTAIHVYRILAAQRTLHRRRAQMNFFHEM